MASFRDEVIHETSGRVTSSLRKAYDAGFHQGRLAALAAVERELYSGGEGLSALMAPDAPASRASLDTARDGGR